MADAGIADFLGQIPFGFLLMFCGSGIALVVSLTLIVNARRQKAQRLAMSMQPAAPVGVMPLMAYETREMPDLDSLLNSPPPAPPAKGARPGVQPVTLTDGETVEAIELLTVMRDVSGGGLIVEINEKKYRVRGSMSDTEFRNKLKSLMKEVATALGGSAPLNAPVGTPNGASVPTPSVAAPSVAVSSDTPTPAAPVEVPRFTPSAPPASSAVFDLPKFSLDNTNTPMSRKELKQQMNAPIAQIDIAGAIEAFLQHKLATTAQFPGRQIHVKPAKDGGIRIQVDSEFFESVGDVSEGDIQAFLKATIAEWQERQ
jgi:hypothetical protein